MLRRKAEVQIHVPATDPAQDVNHGMDAWKETFNQVLAQRDDNQRRCEFLMAKLEALQHVHREAIADRDYWRSVAVGFINIDGQLGTTIEGAFKFLSTAMDAIQKTKAWRDRLPQPHGGNGEAPLDLDAPLADQHQNPTQEEIEEIRNTLAKLPQQ